VCVIRSTNLEHLVRTRSVGLLVVLLLIATAAPALAHHGSATVRGSGFGHGIGMSQYGARSMAVKGHTAGEILGHYYRSTSVPNADVSGNLALGLTTTNTVRFQVPPGSTDVTVQVGGGTTRVARAGQEIRVVHVSGTACDLTIGTTTDRHTCSNIRIPLTTAASHTPTAFVRVLRSPAAHDITMGRGIIEIKQPATRTSSHNINARLLIRMTPYLYGLAEMPSSWPEEALKSQAIAGRTYAQRLRLDRDSSATWQNNCSCHLRTTTADQYYTGWAKESEPTWGARWKKAVDDTGTPGGTGDRVVMHDGRIITAWYSSSSAGHTEWSGDIWSNDLPWAVGVEDPYSVDADAGNSMASWTRNPSYHTLTDRVGLASITSMRVVERNRSGSARTLEARGFAGCAASTKRVSSLDLRSWLGLPSHAIESMDVTGATAACEWFEGDFNGDGRGDVAGYNSGTGEWVVGISNGSSYSFSTWNTFSTISGWETHLVADVNGNGRDEILSYHPGTGNWVVQRSNGSRFTTEAWTSFKTGSGWNTHVVGNVDGRTVRGRPVQGIVSFHGGSGNWIVTREHAGKVSSSVWARYRTRSGWETHVADVNRSGRDDLVNYHPRSGNWVVSTSTGSAFSTSTWANYRTTTGWTNLVADVNGDGRSDIASFHSGSGNWIVGRSTGSSFSTGVWTRFSTAEGWQTHLAGNVTGGDARDELISYHPRTGNWIVTRQVGSSVRSEVWSTFGARTGWAHHFVTDVNRDGRADVASFNQANTWWVNRSTGSTFSASRWGDLR
jgi:SpoIID/LytB domain protein